MTMPKTEISKAIEQMNENAMTLLFKWLCQQKVWEAVKSQHKQSVEELQSVREEGLTLSELQDHAREAINNPNVPIPGPAKDHLKSTLLYSNMASAEVHKVHQCEPTASCIGRYCQLWNNDPEKRNHKGRGHLGFVWIDWKQLYTWFKDRNNLMFDDEQFEDDAEVVQQSAEQNLFLE